MKNASFDLFLRIVQYKEEGVILYPIQILQAQIHCLHCLRKLMLFLNEKFSSAESSKYVLRPKSLAINLSITVAVMIVRQFKLLCPILFQR